MIILGGIHSLLRDHSAQLLILLGCEAAYICFLVFSMSYWKAHRVASKVWFVMIFAFIRVLIQGVLIFQQSYDVVGTGSLAESLIEQILSLLLVVYFFSIYSGTAW